MSRIIQPDEFCNSFRPRLILPHYQYDEIQHRHANGYEEVLHINDHFRLIRASVTLARPLEHAPFGGFGYIGLCFTFADADPSALAHPHLYHRRMNISNGYRYRGGIDRALHIPLTYISLRFDRDWLKNLAAEQPLPRWMQTLLGDNDIIDHIDIPPALRQHAWQMSRLPLAATPAARLRLEAAALEWLAMALEWHNTPPAPGQRIEQALAIIEHEYGEHLTIASLARRCGLNECYLKRQFKAQTGQSIAQALNARRLARACELLRQYPEYSLRDIASQSGHPLNYFYRWFEKYQGESPSAYRARHSGKNSRNDSEKFPETP